jgi:hypothetical protein
LFIPTGFDS